MEYKSLGDYYYYTKPLGQGSFSTIYRGYRIIDRKPVAIKKFTRYIDKKYIDSEINLMKNLDNENILKLYDVLRIKDVLYLILEYCNQGDLSKYILSRNNENDTYYIYQLLNGLKYLYSNNILHRDIKPQNILIDKNIIKICDFGFAKSVQENDLINTFCGSPLYMAPEILKFSEYTEKADIWSLGVIIYEIIFKDHPYPSKTRKELIANIKNNTDIVIPANIITEELTFILKKMLDKNELTRISWDEIFKSTWFINYNSKNDNRMSLIDEDSINDLQSSEVIDDESSMIFEMDEDLDNIPSKNREFFSVNEYSYQKTKPINVNYHSTIESNKIVTRYDEYEDCKVYSRSAPNKTTNNVYLENYINRQEKMNSLKGSDEGYKIIGTSPGVNNNSGTIYSALNKSVNTIKNFFNF